MARVDNLSKKSEICDLSGSADSCDVQEAAGDVARDRPCENKGLEMGRVGPTVEVGPAENIVYKLVGIRGYSCRGRSEK